VKEKQEVRLTFAMLRRCVPYIGAVLNKHSTVASEVYFAFFIYMYKPHLAVGLLKAEGKQAAAAPCASCHQKADARASSASSGSIRWQSALTLQQEYLFENAEEAAPLYIYTYIYINTFISIYIHTYTYIYTLVITTGSILPSKEDAERNALLYIVLA